MLSTSSTTSNHDQTTLTLADLEKVVDAVKTLQPDNDWMLASPDGRVWKGKPDKLLQVLIPYHPLLKVSHTISGDYDV